MNDWNGNGKYDPADNYMDYKLSGAGGQSGGSSGNGGCGWGIIAIICFLVVLLAVCCR